MTFRDHFLNNNYTAAIEEATAALKETKAFDAIHIIGLSMLGLGKVQEAVEWLATSIAWPNAHPGWFINAGMAVKDTQHPELALMFLKRGLAVHPDNTDILCAYGLCLAILGRWEDAIASFDKALTIDPNYNVASTKGMCLYMLGRHEEAEALWRISEPTPEVICTWVCSLITRGKPQEALELLETNRFDPEPLVVTYNKSVLYLGTGNWPLGWDLYRNRTAMIDTGKPILPPFKSPLAQSLDDIRGKHLLLFSEQGLGDNVMFLRFAKLLVPYVAKLTLMVTKPLNRLVQNMAGDFEVRDLESLDETDIDIVMPMMHPPAFLGTTVDTIPKPAKFHIPMYLQDHHWMPSDKPKIGLVWTGSTPDSPQLRDTADRRSMSFETMAPLLSEDGFTFISLQMPDHRVDDHRLLQPLNSGCDMLDTAAIIQQFDLAITIDSVVAHLAGSLGKPVWMLSRYDGEWRWFWDHREDSPWYPSMRIYQQMAPHSWPDVIQRVKNDLEVFRRSAVQHQPTQQTQEHTT